MQELPVITVNAVTIPEAWEKAVLEVWEYGMDIPTKYDATDDPPSKDASALIQVTRPLQEPMIHKNFPGGIDDLAIYTSEVVDGIHDHWVTPAGDTKWDYAYHDRLFNYHGIDQIQECVINKLVDTYHNRRCQAITWQPDIDIDSEHSPCLQRLHFRLTKDCSDSYPVYYLHMTSHWRSRDLYQAWFMNTFAFVLLQTKIASKINEEIPEKVRVGSYIDFSNSLHIYGSDFGKVKPELNKMLTSSYVTRSWRFDEPIVQEIMGQTYALLEEDPDYMLSGR